MRGFQQLYPFKWLIENDDIWEIHDKVIKISDMSEKQLTEAIEVLESKAENLRYSYELYATTSDIDGYNLNKGMDSLEWVQSTKLYLRLKEELNIKAAQRWLKEE